MSMLRSRRLLAVLVTMVFLFSLIFVGQVNGATNYYVSTSGSDTTGNGSSGSPWRTLAYACAHVASNQGNTINLGAGTFTEANIVTIPSGINVIGAGSSQTTVRVNHYFDITNDFDQWTGSSYHPEHFVIQMNGSNQTVKGFYLDGQSRACAGGIYASNATNFVFDDLKIQNFRASGLWVNMFNTVEVKNCYIRNNAMANQSGDSGNVQYHEGVNLYIHHNTIQEDGAVSPDKGGYGIKKCPFDSWDYSNTHFVENMKVYENTITVPTAGGWVNPGDGSYAPAIALENNGIILKNCEIYNNTLNNHISLVGSYATMGGVIAYTGKTLRIHNNYFNLGLGRYAYAVEANIPELEIDHNLFYGGLYPIAQWQGSRTNFVNHYIHHNVFEGQWNGRQVLLYGMSPGGNGMMFYNNTIVDSTGIGKIFEIGGGTVTGNFRNNIFTSTYGSRGNIFGVSVNGTVTKNCFYNISQVGSSNVTSNPQISYSGSRPNPYYTLNSGSPCINAGVVISPYTDGYSGSAPDMGAFEYGTSGWNCGVGSGETPPPPPPPTDGIVNDDASGITFSGSSWGDSNGRGFGDYNDDVHYVTGNSEYFQYTFTGTGIDFITEKNTDEGNVDIYIDNAFQQTVNCYNSTRLAQQTVYSKTGLSSGSHTIKGVKTSGQFMLLDAFKVYTSNPPPPPPEGEASFVTGQSLTNLRNDYTGWVGMKFTVGASPVTVTGLGRWVVSGNSGTHTVKLVKASDGSDVAGGSVSVNTSGAPSGQFKYVSLGSSITLSANTGYYLVSSETSGQDQWYHSTTGVTTTSVAACNNPIYWSGSTWANDGTTANRTFVPVSFMYQTTEPDPPPTPVIYQAENATLSGPAVQSSNAGYTGTGYADYTNSSNDYIEWTVNVPAAGTYTLTWRYANGSTTDRPLEVKVNGTVIAASKSFPVTGGWSTWSEVSITASLNAGNNTVRTTAIGSSGGNLDYLKVQ